MVTRADVARLAGVSTATVSYVLNHTKHISPETTKRVMDAVRELDYRPDFVARSLSQRQTKQLAIFMDDATNPLYGEIIRSFEECASEKGYFVSICASQRRFQEYFDNAISRRLDGLFIMAPPRHYGAETLRRVAGRGIRVITSGYYDVDREQCSSIENDFVSAMRKGMLHLYDRGHRDIAFLTGLTSSMQSDMRIRGYVAMLESLRLACGTDLLVEGSPDFSTSMDDGYALARRLMERGKPFTAVICVNDLTAIGAYTAFTRAGLRIPEDVAVMGFDDIAFSKFTNPPLTTFAIDKRDFGARAFRMLYDSIQNGKTTHYVNPLTFIERQSTAVWR